MRPVSPTLVPWVLSLGLLMIPVAAARGQDRKPDPPAGAAPVDATIEDLLAAHNKVRAAEKLPPLRLNPRLTESARVQARDMAEHTRLTHEGSDGSDSKTRIKRTGYHYEEIGENVAVGQETVAEAMRSWIESPPHRENLLGPFTEMGGAVAKGADDRNYWCVDFGRPMTEVDPAKGPAAMIEALNRARSDARKNKLKADPRLARVAAAFAKEAVERGSLPSRNRDGKTPFEVLQASGYRARRFATILSSGEGDPGKVLASWLRNSRERDALLASFERAGVGVASDNDGVPYWVILLAQGASP